MSGPLRWEPPEGPGDKRELWRRIISEVVEDYPEADVTVTQLEDGGAAWAVLAVVNGPEPRILGELTDAIVAALRNAGLDARPAA